MIMQPVPDSHSPPGHDRPANRRTLEHFTGCLLGGAVGDTLAAPAEFHRIHAICSEYVSAGITDYDTSYGRRGAITDDTQITLFTAEGLLRAMHTPCCRKSIAQSPGNCARRSQKDSTL